MILTKLLLQYNCVHDYICDSDWDFFRKIVCKIMKKASISVLPAMPFQHHRNYYPLLLYIAIYACPLNVVMIVGED